jgi:hypothetical protein
LNTLHNALFTLRIVHCTLHAACCTLHTAFTGSVVRKLNKLGFPNVYNKCEDFYLAIAAGDDRARVPFFAQISFSHAAPLPYQLISLPTPRVRNRMQLTHFDTSS